MRLSAATAASLAALALSACSSASTSPGPTPPGGTTPGDPAAGGGSGGGTAPTMPAYPPGPYSSGVGGVLPDVRGQGYRLSIKETDSKNLPWDPDIDVAEYHARVECACLVISVGATWCGDCMAEQPLLVQGVTSDPAFCVLGVLQDGLSGGTGGTEATATPQDVFDWTQQFHQNFYVIEGNEGTAFGLIMGHGTGSSVPLPFSLIVKPSTMTVVGEVLGSRQDIHDYATGLCAQ